MKPSSSRNWLGAAGRGFQKAGNRTAAVLFETCQKNNSHNLAEADLGPLAKIKAAEYRLPAVQPLVVVNGRFHHRRKTARG